MLQRIISIAFIPLFLISCEKEPNIKEFPIIITLNATNIDASGATFRGELIKEGRNKTTSYGFIWSVQEPNINTSQKEVLGSELSEGVFETRIDFSLAKGFEYKIKAFATYSNKTVYGNTVTLLSKGCKQSIWSKELSDISIDGGGEPYGWSDGSNGYLVFQNAKVFQFDPNKKLFSQIADFPKSGNSGTSYTSVGIDNIQYVFSNLDNNLYKFEEGEWSIKSKTPFPYSSFVGYYHGSAYEKDILLLSTTQSFSYNPNTNIWQTKLSCPGGYGNYSIGGADLNGKVYVMTQKKYINEYNPVNDSWISKTTYPGILKDNIIAFSHENKIYLGFCYADYDNRETEWFDRSFWSFDVLTNSWEEIEPFPKDLDFSNVFFFYLYGKLYIGHGNSKLQSSKYYTIYTLDTSKL